MHIFIPTKGRSNRQVTADQLRAAGIAFTLVCSADDTNNNLRAYKASNRSTIESPAPTISQKRQWILDNFHGPKVVMLDDDLTFYARVNKSKFRIATSDDLAEMFNWIEHALSKYAHAGIVDKFMSNATPRGHVLSRRYNAVLAYNLKLFGMPKVKFRIPVSEEHDVHLQLATRGLPPIVSTEWSKNTSYYQSGGCTDERTARSEREGHRKFAELWPEYVKMIPHKTNISGFAIRVRWQAAAAAGRRAAA